MREGWSMVPLTAHMITYKRIIRCTSISHRRDPWWRHQMEHFPCYWPFVRGIHRSPVNGEFPSQRPVTRSFDIFFDLRLNTRLNKQSWGWLFETPSRSSWRHFNAHSFWYNGFMARIWGWKLLHSITVCGDIHGIHTNVSANTHLHVSGLHSQLEYFFSRVFQGLWLVVLVVFGAAD